MTGELRVGDRVRVLDTDYTRTHHDVLGRMIGQVGTIVEVHAYPGMNDLLGFEAIYDVQVRPWAPMPLISADVELVERSARIRS